MEREKRVKRSCYSILLIASFILGLGLAAPVFGQGDAGKAPASGVVGINIEREASGRVLIRWVEKGARRNRPVCRSATKYSLSMGRMRRSSKARRKRAERFGVVRGPRCN